MKAIITLQDDSGKILDEHTVPLNTSSSVALEGYAEVVPETVKAWDGGAVIEITVHNRMPIPVLSPHVAFALDGNVAVVWSGSQVVSQPPFHFICLNDTRIEAEGSARCRIKVTRDSDQLPYDFRLFHTPPTPPAATPTAPIPEVFEEPQAGTEEFRHLLDIVPLHDDLSMFLNQPQIESAWGEENSEVLPPEATPHGQRGLRTIIRANTSSNSDNGVGGTGFDHRFTGHDAALLRYRLRFDDDFDFVKGGKLPGLAGGDTPSGGKSADNGFSARLMWRTDGDGEVYLYTPYRENRYGDSIGRGLFRFLPGDWTTIQQQIELNSFDAAGDPRADGVLRLWVNDEPILALTNVVFRLKPEVKVDALMYTLFFGGNGVDWRTPRDQIIDSCDYQVWVK